MLLNLVMQISRFFYNCWNIHQEFLDISFGRSWQNFLKSEQEKLRGKLDSAIFNFRLPPSNAFARVLQKKKKNSYKAPNGEQTALRECDITMEIRGRGRSGNWCRQNMENESSHDLLARQPSQNLDGRAGTRMGSG